MSERTAGPARGSTAPALAALGGAVWQRVAIQEIGIFLILLTLVVLLSLRTTTFLTATNIFNVLRAFSWIAISAFGECLVIITAGIDLSVGSVMALSGLASAILLREGVNVPLAVAGGLATGTFIGFINGLLVTKGKLRPFIATLGTMSIARGFCYGLVGGWPVRNLPPSFNALGQTDASIGPWGVPLPVIIMLGLAVLTSLFLTRTVGGQHIYAVGGNEEAARVSGIGIDRVKLLVYTACGLLTAIGGLLMTARLGVAAPTAALGYELDIIAAVVIGGTSLAGGEGTILGVLIGAAIMQVLRNGMVLMGVQAYWQPAAIGAVIILAIMLDELRRRRE